MRTKHLRSSSKPASSKPASSKPASSKPAIREPAIREPARAGANRPAGVLAGVLFCALGACLSAPDSDQAAFDPVCATTADCDSGEVCDVGICWGNPPTRQFAAMLWPPPETRMDLAPTEIVELNIASDGIVENLSFAPSATIRGSVLLECGQLPSTECDPTRSIAARITFARPSIIPGQPPYTRSVTSVPGRVAGEASFSVALPLSDVEYQVAVLPTGSTAAASNPVENPAVLAPPSHQLLLADKDMDVEWRLGAPSEHTIVTGRVVDLLDVGIPNMRVFAVEGNASLSPDERISSIMSTGEDGVFALRLPDTRTEPFDLVAIPVEEGSAPALRASGRSASGIGTVAVGDLVMPGYADLVRYTVPVRGIDGNGDDVAIAGATVRVTTLLGGAAADTVATFSTLAYTDERGLVELQLLPPNNMQNRTYLVDIEPLGGSEHALLHGHELDVGTDAGGVLEAIRLGRRVAVSGQVTTRDGQPAAGSTVKALLSEAFRQALEPDDRALVDSLQLPSASTDQSGRFVLWLDDRLADREAAYDLRLVQSDPLAPLWSVRGVRMGDQTEFGTVDIGAIVLPTASYARGTVRDLAGAPVPGAQIRWFELLDDADACADSAGQPCVSVFRGIDDADQDGWVMLVLPE